MPPTPNNKPRSFQQSSAKQGRSALIAVMGPTACGKTALAIELAKALDGEIISVDSALVYKGMDIGTAKPNAHEMAQAKHHLIDVCDPCEPYSASQFATDAKRLINEIQARGKRVILAGGTMLYFKALLDGMANMPSSDAALRAQLNEQLNTLGAEVLHERLQKIDPASATRIHPNDPQRLLRALEVHALTGQTLSEFHAMQSEQQTEQSSVYDVMKIGLIPSCRETHRKLVAKRFEFMLEAGFLKEAEALFKREDLHLDLPAIRSVGYRQAWLYFQGEYSFDEMSERAIIATRQLAKRQMTWLRKEPNLNTFDGLKDNTHAVLAQLKIHT